MFNFLQKLNITLPSFRLKSVVFRLIPERTSALWRPPEQFFIKNYSNAIYIPERYLRIKTLLDKAMPASKKGKTTDYILMQAAIAITDMFIVLKFELKTGKHKFLYPGI